MKFIETRPRIESANPIEKTRFLKFSRPPPVGSAAASKSFKYPPFRVVGVLKIWMRCRVVAPSGGATYEACCWPHPSSVLFLFFFFLFLSFFFSLPFSFFLFRPFPFHFFFSSVSYLFLLLSPCSRSLFLPSSQIIKRLD